VEEKKKGGGFGLWIALGVIALALVGPLLAWQLGAWGDTLSAEEQAPPELAGGQVRHAALGFSFSLPEDFTAEPLVELPRHKRLAMWGWGDPLRGHAVRIALVPYAGDRALERELAALRKAENTLVGAQDDVRRVVIESRQWHRHVTIGTQHVRTDAFVHGYPGGHDRAVVVVSTSGGEDDVFADLAASFSPRD
jgi:hypothetical protein